MDTANIVTELRQQKERITLAIKALKGSVSGIHRRTNVRDGARKRKRLSAAARRRISEAAKARWAKAKRAGRNSL